MKATIATLVCACALMGCAGAQGSGGGGGGGDGGGGSAPQAGFRKINTDIFEPNCTYACHSGGEFAAGGLDMKSDPYRTLVGVRAVAEVCKSSPLVRVAPGKPDQSLVYLKVATKLEGKPAPCGDGMPAGVDRAALSADEVDAIRTWIEDGAPND